MFSFCLWGLRCLSSSASFPPWLLAMFCSVVLSSYGALGWSLLSLLWGLSSVLFLRRVRFYAAPPTAGYSKGFLHLFWLRLPVLFLRWWSRLGSHPFPCVLSASLARATLPLFAGCRALCKDSAIWVVTSLGLAVWRCLRAPQAFRALLVGWSGFPSSPPAVLGLCGC